MEADAAVVMEAKLSNGYGNTRSKLTPFTQALFGRALFSIDAFFRTFLDWDLLKHERYTQEF